MGRRERNIAIVIGCVSIYIVMNFITGGQFKVWLFVALIAYGIYKVSKY